MKIDRKRMAPLLVFLLAAALAGGFVLAGRDKKPSADSAEVTAAATLPGPETADVPVTAESAPLPEAEESEAEESKPELSPEQTALLDELWEDIRQGDYEKAARTMFDAEEQCVDLYYKVMQARRYLYSGGSLKEELEGEGLVMVRPSLIFAGNFADGAPEGQCVAFQVIELDYRRYDYSAGEWKNGRMNGSGETGYCYFEGAGEESQKMSRQGTFVDDRMEGECILSTLNSQGEESSWNMETEDGRLVLNDAWVYDEEENVYQLFSNQSSGYAYIVTEDTAEGQRFQNLLVWE